MKKVELNIEVVTRHITQSSSYALVLSEKDGPRKLPVVIGPFEAQAIAMVLENMTPTRPLTHDTMKNVLTELNILLREVIIQDLKDGIFYSLLVLEKDGKIFQIDSRTSDAIALAVRFGCPIYTYEFILESAGVMIEPEAEEGSTRIHIAEEELGIQDDLSKLTLEELNELLEDALEKEDYERAASIRDEIKKRSKN